MGAAAEAPPEADAEVVNEAATEPQDEVMNQSEGESGPEAR